MNTLNISTMDNSNYSELEELRKEELAQTMDDLRKKWRMYK